MNILRIFSPNILHTYPGKKKFYNVPESLKQNPADFISATISNASLSPIYYQPDLIDFLL